MRNQLLQSSLKEVGLERNIDILIPSGRLEFFIWLIISECTDNAVMIAWRGLQLYQLGRNIIQPTNVDSIRYNDHLDFSSYSF